MFTKTQKVTKYHIVEPCCAMWRYPPLVFILCQKKWLSPMWSDSNTDNNCENVITTSDKT